MLKPFLLISTLIIKITFAQTNLVFNGSFEDFIPIGQQDQLTFSSIYYNYLNPQTYDLAQLSGTSNHLYVHQIDCWTNTPGSNDVYQSSSILVLSSNQGPLSLYNPHSVFSFGIPYNFDFTSLNPFGIGSNVLSASTFPTKGDTYVAMITHPLYGGECETPTDGGGFTLDNPRLSSTLLHEILPHKDYILKIDLQKIAHLNSYCPEGPFSSLDSENPKIKIKLHKSSGGSSKVIFNKKIDHTNWVSYSEPFHVNTSGYDRIEIILKTETGQNEGVFIDNVQLYDACETPENTCENPELFKPLFNIDIHTLNIDGTTSQGVPYELKTVEVSNLMVAKYAKISITDMSGNTTYRVIYDGENPPPNITWDGKNDDGNIMPDGWYKCKVEASNLCYEETYTHKFKKQFEAQVFDPLIEVNADGGVTISGLDKAALAVVYVEHTVTGIELFAKVSVMPESEIAWNGTYDGNFGSGAIVESGFYLVGVLLQSKCGLEIYEKIVFLNEGDLSFSYLNGSFNDPLYDWAIVPDKIVPECTISGNLKPFYRVPKDCCVGDLYLEGENLWGDLTFNIVGTIYINNNVTTDPGSIITMNAGGEIILTPNSDGTEFTLGSDVHLNPNVICEPCDCNKSMSSENDTSDKEIITLVPVETSAEKTEAAFVTISPNPSSEFVRVSFSEEKQFISYKIYNVSGEFMQSGVIITSPVRVDVSALPAGEYFIQLSTGMEFESYKIVVQ